MTQRGIHSRLTISRGTPQSTSKVPSSERCRSAASDNRYYVNPCRSAAINDDAAPSAPGLAPRAPGSNSLDPSQKFFNFDQMRPGDFPEFDSRGSVILGTGTASEREGNEYEWAVVDESGDVVETPRRLIGFVVEGQD